jgi:hypothetical protein
MTVSTKRVRGGWRILMRQKKRQKIHLQGGHPMSSHNPIAIAKSLKPVRRVKLESK